jgi:hypothetical protein
MVSVKGIYDGEKVQLLEEILVQKACKVIVTFIDEDTDIINLRQYPSDEEAFDFWKANEEDIYQDYLQKPE